MAAFGSLPGVAAATSEVWPSVADAITVPWRTVTSRQRTKLPSSYIRSVSTTPPLASKTTSLPACLHDGNIQSLLQPKVFGSATPMRSQNSISVMSQAGLLAANPILRRPFFQTSKSPLPSFARPFTRSTFQVMAIRKMSTTGQMRSLGLRPAPGFSILQSRTFGSIGGISRSQLASAEGSANRNTGNANIQNAFYQLLLRANMPGIVVDRYQTGRFATNPVTDDIYKKAMAALNSNTSSSSIAGGVSSSTATSYEQAVGHAAVAGASSAGANSRGHKGEPIHVVVEESLKSSIFRWFRFITIFLVTTYICFALVTILIETLSSFRRGAGGQKDAEVKAEKQNTRFSDVHGCDEAKEELQEVVEFLKNPEKFSDLGAKLPRGVLLVGPPGTGKTLLARAVAGEAGVPFFYMSGSEFDEVFVGVGAKRVRDLFTAAKSKSPAIVFIDELDAIGGKRNPRDQAHAKQTLNQLLTELDGFDQDSRIIIMGATNLPKLLDKALTRPGRFDRHINVDLPDYRGRVAILRHHAQKIKGAPDVDIEAIAARCVGRSGADLENMVNVAALRASRRQASFVSRSDMEWAYDRLTLGSERKSMVVSEKEKEMTAYHEAGHALVQLFDKENSRQLYKVTILPKGPSLGHTAHVPQTDKYSYTAAEYMSDIRVCLGGKMAEEMHYGNDRVTSGVSSDLERATDLSFMMVTNFGMSSALGPVEYNRRYENLSSETRAMIEAEVQKTLKASYEDVRTLLTEKRKELDLLAKALVRYETLDLSEVQKVIKGEDLPGKPVLPGGPLIMPIPDDVPSPPGLGGVGHPQPPEETPAPPTAAA